MTTASAVSSHARVIVPTRNSCSIGWSSGSASASVAAGSGALSAPTCSRRSASRSASTATCSFSSTTEVMRDPDRAWRKNARSPGGPTVPLTNRSGRSSRWTSMGSTLLRGWWIRSGAAADGRVGSAAPPSALGRAGAVAECGEITAGVVDVEYERAMGGVLDDADRTRSDHDALELVEVQAERVGDHGLDDVAVADGHPDPLRADLVLNLGVPAPDRREGPRLHLDHPLAAGEESGARMLLDGLPELVLREVLEPMAGPLAVTALGQPLVPPDPRPRRLRLRSGDLPRGLEGALQRAADDPRERKPGESAAQLDGLLLPGLVEMDARCTSGEDAVGVGGGTTVPYQDREGHRTSVRRSCQPPVRSGPDRRLTTPRDQVGVM